MDILLLARNLRNIVRTCRSLLGPNSTLNFNGSEADSAALCLQQLSLSHASGVYVLALNNVNWAYPATTCARAAFEAGVIAVWLSLPSDSAQRHRRWLGHWQKISKFYSKQGNALEGSNPGINKKLMDIISEREDMYKRFALNAPNILPENPPKIEDMLDEIGYSHLYAGYTEACEISHSGPEAVIRSRHRNPSEDFPQGICYEISVDVTDWAVAFQMAGWGATIATYHALKNHGTSDHYLIPLLEKQSSFDKMIKKITVA